MIVFCLNVFAMEKGQWWFHKAENPCHCVLGLATGIKHKICAIENDQTIAFLFGIFLE